MQDLQRVMHGIAIKKYATVEDISALTALEGDAVEALVAEAVAKGRASEVNGKYLLTPVGQMTLKSAYSKIYGALRKDDDFVAAYEDFERINNDLKQAITDWQTIEVGGQTVPNDHSDQSYDESVIDRIGAIHERVDVVLKRLGSKEERLHRYREQLLDALEKAEDGDIAWVSDATIGSYHTVWFELHEDLLRVMGREREEH
jgi:translation elongation factor EF-Ts